LLCFGQPGKQLHALGCLVPDVSIGISESNEKRRKHCLEVDGVLRRLVRRNKREGMRQRSSAQPRVFS
jgi:hypothetical protein